MQVQESRVLSNLSNAPPRGLGSTWSALDNEDPQELQLFCGAAGRQLLRFVRKSRSKNQTKGCDLADEKERTIPHRVHFRMDQDNCATAETFPNSAEKFTHAEYQALWWNNEELLDIRQSALSICDYLRESEKDYCRAAGMLVAICALSDTEESSLPTTNSVLTCASHRKARGLTILIVPILRIRRKRTIQLVLQAQADMRDQIHSDSMLAAKYHYWSRYATAWARVLAEQDTAGCCE
jgi:hypothetical protein